MLIAEEFMLLSLDNESGNPLIANEGLRPALGGALIAELALMERIGVTSANGERNRRGRITITNLTPPMTGSWTRRCASWPRVRARRSRTC